MARGGAPRRVLELDLPVLRPGKCSASVRKRFGLSMKDALPLSDPDHGGEACGSRAVLRMCAMLETLIWRLR